MYKNMFRIVLIATFLAFGSMIGCEDAKKEIKHMRSSISGIQRTVTLYAGTGNVVKKWEGKFKVELSGGVATFIVDGDKEVKISGTYTIEEN